MKNLILLASLVFCLSCQKSDDTLPSFSVADLDAVHAQLKVFEEKEVLFYAQEVYLMNPDFNLKATGLSLECTRYNGHYIATEDNMKTIELLSRKLGYDKASDIFHHYINLGQMASRLDEKYNTMRSIDFFNHLIAKTDENFQYNLSETEKHIYAVALTNGIYLYRNYQDKSYVTSEDAPLLYYGQNSGASFLHKLLLKKYKLSEETLSKDK